MPSIEKMIAHAVDIANDDTHGYSWADRWDTDRDCSSLMYDSANAGGYAIGRGPDKTRYTGTMPDDFKAAGFTLMDYAVGKLQRGDVLLRDPWGSGGHTELYIGDGLTVGAHIAETGGVYGRPGDQTGHEISIEPNPGNWLYILRPPADVKPEQKPGKPVNDAGFRYRVHCQDIGWCPWVRDGQTAGTTGFSKRMEALTYEPPEGFEIQVLAHIQNKGWVTGAVAKHGKPATVGTTGQSLRIEALIVKVVKAPSGKKIRFRVHQQNIGWKAWTPAGYMSGSTDQSARLEAVQIEVM